MLRTKISHLAFLSSASPLILCSTFPCSMTMSRRASPFRQSFAMRAPSLGAWNGQSPDRMSDCELPGASPPPNGSPPTYTCGSISCCCCSLLQHDDGSAAAHASIAIGEGSFTSGAAAHGAGDAPVGGCRCCRACRQPWRGVARQGPMDRGAPSTQGGTSSCSERGAEARWHCPRCSSGCSLVLTGPCPRARES